ncbi:DDE-type integrase/transposase/recombinase [Bacillus cereus]|nr:DDE-type integrase/transposase/recombinase [Bacillus cereus]
MKEAKLEQAILTIWMKNHFRYGHRKVNALLKRKYNYHLNRNFQATKPNEKWVTDITYLPFGTEMLYLSSIMDLYNNEIIAYEISNRQDVTLVLKTIEKAIKSQQKVKYYIIIKGPYIPPTLSKR